MQIVCSRYLELLVYWLPIIVPFGRRMLPPFRLVVHTLSGFSWLSVQCTDICNLSVWSAWPIELWVIAGDMYEFLVWGGVCAARAWHATFVLTIPRFTLPQIYSPPEEPPFRPEWTASLPYKAHCMS